MTYRRLGRSGLMVAPLVLGTMNFGGVTDKKESIRIIDETLDAAGIGRAPQAVENAGHFLPERKRSPGLPGELSSCPGTSRNRNLILPPGIKR